MKADKLTLCNLKRDHIIKEAPISHEPFQNIPSTSACAGMWGGGGVKGVAWIQESRSS